MTVGAVIFSPEEESDGPPNSALVRRPFPEGRGGSTGSLSRLGGLGECVAEDGVWVPVPVPGESLRGSCIALLGGAQGARSMSMSIADDSRPAGGGDGFDGTGVCVWTSGFVERRFLAADTGDVEVELGGRDWTSPY